MNGGGAEKVVLVLANYFVSKGYKVDLLLTLKKGPYLQSLSQEVNIIELSSKRVIFDFFKLTNYIKKNKPDLILSGMTHCNLLSIASTFVSGDKNKVYATQHANFSESMKRQKPYESFLFNFLIRSIYKKADGIVCVSKGVKTDFDKSFPFLSQKSIVIYNPFEIAVIKKKSYEAVSHPWLEGPRNYKVIISVGRLTLAKDFLNLLSAFLILKERDNVRLIILGEGHEKDDLTDFINNNNLNGIVDLHGFVDNPFALISKADAFVVSSKYEGLSNVLIEAMICGVPLISTDCPSGPAEILEGGRWGRLVPVDDSEALANAIYNTINSEDDVLDYSSRTRDFDSHKIGEQYLNYIFN